MRSPMTKISAPPSPGRGGAGSEMRLTIVEFSVSLVQAPAPTFALKLPLLSQRPKLLSSVTMYVASPKGSWVIMLT